MNIKLYTRESDAGLFTKIICFPFFLWWIGFELASMSIITKLGYFACTLAGLMYLAELIK